MVTTENIGITLVEQAQKEVTVNEGFKRIDALMNRGVLSASFIAPPASPEANDMYIIAENPTGGWANHASGITYYDQIWRFVTPQTGSTVWVQDVAAFYYYDGAAWQVATSSGGGGSNPTGADLFGINTTADTTNRLAVKSDAALFTADSQDIRAVLNKTDSADTASFLFQQGFQGRAEFGLTGSDDFTLKVSGDGSNFAESFVVDHATGDLACQQQLSAPASKHRQMVMIEAKDMMPSLTDGCSPLLQTEFGTKRPDIATLGFNHTNIQYAHFSYAMPDAWDGGDITAQCLWTHDDTALSGAVVWTMQALARSNGNSIGVTFGSVRNQTDSSSGGGRLYISNETTPIIPSGSPEAGDMIYFRVSRNTDSSSDTLTEGTRLMAVRLFYNINGLDNA